MDASSLLALVPTGALPYVTAAVAIAAALATVLPKPTTDTGTYAQVYRVVNWVGLNLGRARNAVMVLLVGGMMALSACSADQVAKVQAANDKALSQLQTVIAAVCRIDAQDQPIVVALSAPVVTAISSVKPAAGVLLAGAVTLDTTVIHPDIIAACARIGAFPVAAVPAVVASK